MYYSQIDKHSNIYKKNAIQQDQIIGKLSTLISKQQFKNIAIKNGFNQ